MSSDRNEIFECYPTLAARQANTELVGLLALRYCLRVENGALDKYMIIDNL